MAFPAAVSDLLRELSAFPYENLSKIVAFGEGRNREVTLSLAESRLEDARAAGEGGTCYSLTWWLYRRLRARGFAAAFLMGDKGRAKNIHCGLRFDHEGRAHLLDPGYMIFDPLPLPEAGLSATAWISPNEVRVEDLAEARAWRLWSGPRGALKPRFDFRRAAVTEEEFLAHWRESYDLPMMRYPVLNRVKDGAQYYLQKRSLLVRTPEGGEMRKLDRTEMMETLGTVFGISEGLARAALDAVLAATPDFFRR